MRATALCTAALLLPALAAAQSTSSSSSSAVSTTSASAPVANPVSQAFRDNARDVARNLMAAADSMQADKYSFKPTPAQMSFGQIMVHLAQGNDYLCGAIGGQQAPQRTKVAATDSKATLVARLKETFAFCDQALANVDDSRLGEALPFFGGHTRTRAEIMTITTGDWADHYSQVAIYMRLNGLLPPTARRAGA